MTSSDQLRRRAEHVVAGLRSDLDERRIAAIVDDPVDRAVAAFRFDGRGPFDAKRFHHLLAAFVTHVYAHGIVPARRLTSTQASAEAIELLDVGYHGTHEVGYDGALLDALTERGSGIDSVLARLAEIIKLRARHRHRQWAFARHLDPLNWPLRCAVAAVLLESRRAESDSGLAASRPERFADVIPDLLDSELSAEAMLDHLVAAALRTAL